MAANLYVVSGPSGVGKGSLLDIVLKNHKNLVYSISCTTRAPRVGEIDGVHYKFISHQQFESAIHQDLFLEYAHVHSDYYGTLKLDVLNQLNLGHNVLLEIDVQGALQVRQKIPDAILIFIAPPSIEVLEQRLKLRNTESQQALNIRLQNAIKELQFKDLYDFIIVNDNLQKAANELCCLIHD